MQGAKWYGVQFGHAYKTPAREDDVRHIPPNFYYDQQDWLAVRQVGRRWTWSGLRPHGVWGFSVASPMNLATALAVYATVSRHLGGALKWPGSPGLFDRVSQLCDVDILARAMVWAATAPTAANEAFNISNGDYMRWRHIWPRLADFFDMDMADPQPVKLASVMADKEPVWADIVEAHQLRKYNIADLTTWQFADYVFANDCDQMSDMNKARAAGFYDFLDTELTVTNQLARMRRDRIIP